MEINGERSEIFVYLSSLRSAYVAMVAVMEEPRDHEAKVGQYCVCVCVLNCQRCATVCASLSLVAPPLAVPPDYLCAIITSL